MSRHEPTPQPKPQLSHHLKRLPRGLSWAIVALLVLNIATGSTLDLSGLGFAAGLLAAAAVSIQLLQFAVNRAIWTVAPRLWTLRTLITGVLLTVGGVAIAALLSDSLVGLLGYFWIYVSFPMLAYGGFRYVEADLAAGPKG